ncbi:(2Fe-2S) ferredoxin domain-containing protein [Acutalibacter caecimuris]|uniref:(2Fe-2S) ferredoxin domain-containing protein n=1 Tax=Acutalibacter caecimuris TaxID=3093657 RepID=UPI002AC9B984|nr:(2Fe-2S) ferredoxin domain-containing protein [Acutalibacter sp. M00118]
MKSLAELQAIRDKARASVNIRENAEAETRVLVGMATCGIAAGARPVLTAFVEEVAKRGLKDTMVTQTGCIGICQYEPVVEIITPGQEKVTYVKMTPEKAVRVVNDHLVNGNVVTEYTIGANAIGAK